MIYCENRVSSIYMQFIIQFKKRLNNRDKGTSIRTWLDNSFNFMEIKVNNVNKIIHLSTKFSTFAN